ncbi:thioredoxin family protein [Ohtaekwangia kribbensis]|jgi:peroxiredoxin|uniref:Thioredoxin family protein n=1 Tax=Ohtaekwangia kribbensis TaxID=688913 RepID=A0ABW3K809_9BACT
MKKTKLSALLALSLVLLFAGRAPKYEIGDSVTDFKLKNVDGKMVALSDYKSAKGVIVIFDCNTCPYSKAYNERIQTLNKNYASKGFPVIAINANSPELSPGDSFEEMKAVAKKKNYEFPYLIDETQQVAKSFGASNTPHVFVLQHVGSDFKVAYIGAIDNNTRDAAAADKKYVEEAVDALLAGKAIPTEKTKAIGCGIKWKNV